KSQAQARGYKPRVRDITYPTCGRCGKHHRGKFLQGSDICFYCGQLGHKHRDCTTAKRDGRKGRALNPSSSVPASRPLSQHRVSRERGCRPQM
ncbi:hypothetical protein HAX54_036171, partial [Datura stramonium]|nr:hypothetical protein [Datura stramonium]